MHRRRNALLTGRDIADQYMFGHAFLVAPIVTPGGQRTVYLPDGREWYDFYDLHESYSGGRTIKVKAPFNRIPVYVPDNTIYVTGTMPLGNRPKWDPAAEKPSYVVHALPGSGGSQTQFEFIDSLDANKSKLMKMSVRMSEIRLSIPALGAPYELHLRTSPPNRVRNNGRPVDAKYDRTMGVYRIPLAANAAAEITVEPIVPGSGL